MNKLIIVGNGFDLAHGLKNQLQGFYRMVFGKNHQ